MPGSSSWAAAESQSCLAFVGIDDVRLINTPFSPCPGRHRLRLHAADGLSHLCQPGEARQAAAGGGSDLGSPPWRTFRQVTLPLSLPGRRHRLHAGLHLLMGEFLIPRSAGRRQGLLHRQRAGRPLPAVPQLGLRLGGRRDPGLHHAGHRQPLYALDDAQRRAARRRLAFVRAARDEDSTPSSSTCFCMRRSASSSCSASTPAGTPATFRAFR